MTYRLRASAHVSQTSHRFLIVYISEQLSPNEAVECARSRMSRPAYRTVNRRSLQLDEKEDFTDSINRSSPREEEEEKQRHGDKLRLLFHP